MHQPYHALRVQTTTIRRFYVRLRVCAALVPKEGLPRLEKKFGPQGYQYLCWCLVGLLLNLQEGT